MPKAAPISIHLPALNMSTGQKTWLNGPSGVGKTTYLHLIFGLLPATLGQINICGVVPQTLQPATRIQWRTRHIGLLAQNPQLLAPLSVMDNLRAAAWAAQVRWQPNQASTLLTELNIGDLAQRRANCLSRGQLQRVALARAVLLKPAIILADEPTANLDDEAATQVLALFTRLSKQGVAVLMASHDSRVATWADTSVTMSPDFSERKVHYVA